MALPFLFNLWACNPWKTEPDRDAALSQQTLGNHFPPPADSVAPTAAEPADARDTWFEDLSRIWETKPAVIPANKHVSGAMNFEVLQFVNDVLRRQGKPELTELECFHRAWYQLHVAGFRITGSPYKDPRNFQIMIERPQPDGSVVDEVRAAETMEAVLYIRESILQDTPVLVGICIKGYPPRPNDVDETTDVVEPTNHYVVIVGMGRDPNGIYFQYYDYSQDPEGGKNPKTRFYLRADLRLERINVGPTAVVEVRRTR